MKMRRIKREKGITIVALVITIIIIIILSTITLNAVFGDNGLIKQASETRDRASNMVEGETSNMNSLMQEYANVMAEDSELPLPFIDVLPTPPKLSDGMIPVKYIEGTGWVKTNATAPEWYDYANKEWANVVLGDATFITSGNYEILDESKQYSMLVWIPRYAYQITSEYHTATSNAGNINIVFVDTNNQNKTKTETYSETYPSYSTGSGMEDYVVHPAFNYGGTKLNGFWVGKYETSHTGCTTDVSTGEASYTGNEIIQIKAGVTSWRNIQVSNIFTVCTELNKEGNPYKLNTNDSVVDPHMMKNSEWGAVAYLSQNTTYGKGEEVWINPNSNYITGQAGYSVSASATETTNAYNTTNGQQASTTGNVTGIYDMSGGGIEYMAAYVNNGNSYLTTYGSMLIDAMDKYKDVYRAATSGADEEQITNYNYTQPNSTTSNYGDAIWETSSDSSGTTSWYSDYSLFPHGYGPFLRRSGFYSDTSGAGLFYFTYNDGNVHNARTFRLVIPVLQ